jgi:hypothetical protein
MIFQNSQIIWYTSLVYIEFFLVESAFSAGVFKAKLLLYEAVNIE